MAKKIILITLITLSLFTVAIETIQAQDDFLNTVANLPRNTSLFTVIRNAINFIFTVALIIAVIALIVGGIMFATAAGDPDKIQTARSMILWAAVGVGVAVLAYTIVAFIQTNIVGTSGG